MIRVSYRPADTPGKWVGMLRDGDRDITECGHEHDNRDMSTAAGGEAATVCAKAILDGANVPAVADYRADRFRTAWTRVDTAAGFVMPAGWLDKVRETGAAEAADYLQRVDVVRAALTAEREPAQHAKPGDLAMVPQGRRRKRARIDDVQVHPQDPQTARYVITYVTKEGEPVKEWSRREKQLVDATRVLVLTASDVNVYGRVELPEPQIGEMPDWMMGE